MYYNFWSYKEMKELQRMTVNPGSPAYFPKNRKRRANKQINKRKKKH